MIITEVGKQCCSQDRDSAMEAYCVHIERKLDLTRPDEITEKNTDNNRTLKYSNELNYSSRLNTVMGILK